MKREKILQRILKQQAKLKLFDMAEEQVKAIQTEIKKYDDQRMAAYEVRAVIHHEDRMRQEGEAIGRGEFYTKYSIDPSVSKIMCYGMLA